MKLSITAYIGGKWEDLVTISQAAKKLKVTRQAVLKMVNNGRIRAVRMPEFYLIPLKDIRRIKRERKLKQIAY